MLEIQGLSAWYGEARVLADVSLSVQAGSPQAASTPWRRWGSP